MTSIATGAGKLKIRCARAPIKIKCHRGNDGGGNGRYIDVAAHIFFLCYEFIVLAWLQAPLTREVRIFFADIVERAR